MAPGIALKWAKQLLHQFTRFARALYYALRPQVFIMAGQEKASGEVMRVCYVGNMPRGYRLGFPGQILRKLDEEVELGPHWVWRIRKLLKVHDCCFTLIESRYYFRRLLLWLIGASGQAFFLPYFVHSIIEIGEIERLLKNNSALKGDIRRTERAGFKLQVSNDPAHFRKFLDSYYLPYMAAAHGSLATVFDYSFLCRADYADRAQWELLQITLEGEWVAGAIVRKEELTSHMLEFGIRNADSSYVKRGALAAAYWLFVLRMQALGYREVSFMWSPPFLENGVLRFKSKYHPKLEAAPSKHIGLLLVPAMQNSLSRKILYAQPMFQLQGSQLKATRFVPGSECLTATREQLIRECRRYSGISGYEIVSLGT